MSGIEINKYAAELRQHLADAGVNDVQSWNVLIATATDLADLADQPPGAVTRGEWGLAQTAWNTARSSFGPKLIEVLLGPLAKIPGLADLTSNVANLHTEGIHGGLDVGPVHLEIASSVLVIQPPTFSNLLTPSAVTIGPYRVGQIAVSIWREKPPGEDWNNNEGDIMTWMKRRGGLYKWRTCRAFSYSPQGFIGRASSLRSRTTPRARANRKERHARH